MLLLIAATTHSRTVLIDGAKHGKVDTGGSQKPN